MFKVVPDQLRVSDGWVRCGQCNEVFDANTHLHNGPALDQVKHSRPAILLDATEHPVQSVAVDVDEDKVKPPETEALSEPFLEVSANALHMDLHPATDETGDSAVHDALQMAVLAEGKEPEAKGESDSSIGEPPVQTSFMRQVQRPSPWHQTWVRVTLSVTATLLAAALILQVTIRERDRIAAVEPASKPFLGPLCGFVGCTISPLRHIESVVIDNSSFTKVRGDIYRLSVTLKNTAQIPVATPDLELTLTDMQDHAVVRRTFRANEFLKTRDAMDPSAEISLAIPVSVKLADPVERVSGYRLLSFYP